VHSSSGVLYAVGSLLGTISKLQAATQQPACLAGLCVGFHLLLSWKAAARDDTALANTKQQQRLRRDAETSSCGTTNTSNSSLRGAAAGLHVVGCYLLRMGSPKQAGAAAAAEVAAATAASGTQQVTPQLPYGPVGLGGRQQAQQQELENGQDQVQDFKVQNFLAQFELLDTTLDQMATLVVAEGSSSSNSSTAAHQQPLGRLLATRRHQLLRDLQLAQNAARCSRAVVTGAVSTVTFTKALLTLQQSLQSVGQALCAAAGSSSCCSNPGCTNLSTVSECFALVRGRQCVCGGCTAAESGAGLDQTAPAARYDRLGVGWGVHMLVSL
jgi:hypothetical protein